MSNGTVLLLGSGGREHAFAWSLSRSEKVTAIVAVPGSDGMAMLPKVQCRAGNPADVQSVLAVAHELKPFLVVVGPEKPLEAGVVDALEAAGFAVAGPVKAAARLESSKIFSKRFMTEFGIPTAPFAVCENETEALQKLAEWNIEGKGVVIKADGLAAGKGVVVTHDRSEAHKTVFDFMTNPACTVKSEQLLLEEMLTGKEVSAFALCDGKNFVTMGYACDYKRVNDGNEGPNTGGMGGYAPEGWPSPAAKKFIEEHVFAKVMAGMQQRGTPYKGILFAGLMIEGDNVSVIEFNTRFGDPETQILFPLIENDMADLLEKSATGKLAEAGVVTFKKQSSVHVVMTSAGYPETYGTGMKLNQVIQFPEEMMATSNDNAFLFMAGTRKENGAWVNTGGRVLGVTALGATIEEARRNAYKAIDKIRFEGAHWRRDIGT